LIDAITKNLDLSGLNWISYSAAKESQMRRSVRIADGLGASKEMSSAYANAPTKLRPIKHPTPEVASLTNKSSK
jgi:hypothetical protein